MGRAVQQDAVVASVGVIAASCRSWDRIQLRGVKKMTAEVSSLGRSQSQCTPRLVVALGVRTISPVRIGSACSRRSASSKVSRSTPMRIAEDVRGGVADDCGHWIPEERPDWVVEQLLAFSGEED